MSKIVIRSLELKTYDWQERTTIICIVKGYIENFQCWDVFHGGCDKSRKQDRLSFFKETMLCCNQWKSFGAGNWANLNDLEAPMYKEGSENLRRWSSKQLFQWFS